jgi:acetyl esterase
MSRTLAFLCGAAAIASASGAFAQTAPDKPPVLAPGVKKFVTSLDGGAPIYTLTPEGARQVLEGAQAGPVVAPKVTSVERTLPVGPKGTTRVRVIRPAGAKGVLPIVMYYHGAGWVMGSPATHDRLVREISVGANAVVVFVDYDRSPEARYPVAIEEDYAATDYVAKHAAEFGGDGTRIAIAGDSVGGNMTAVVSLMAKERKGPRLRAQLLFYPVTDATMSSGSYVTFANGPWLTKPAMTWFWDAYLPDIGKRADIHVSPINATPAQLQGLPPALVITDENDVLRDEGEAYARNLTAAGVPTVSTRYNGTIHDFVLLNAISQTPQTRAAMAQAIAFLREKLG